MIAMPVISNVPFRSCQIPNCASWNSGAHSESVKKFSPTSSKKGIDSLTSATTIPIVVATEIAAARNSSARMMSSPQRRRATPRGRIPGVAPAVVLAASTLCLPPQAVGLSPSLPRSRGPSPPRTPAPRSSARSGPPRRSRSSCRRRTA